MDENTSALLMVATGIFTLLLFGLIGLMSYFLRKRAIKIKHIPTEFELQDRKARAAFKAMTRRRK